MDKYEYNLKLEEIDRLVDQKDYEEAAKIADTIDWRRVRNVRTLCLISEIYEASGRLEDSKRLLVRAYKRSPVGRTVLYRLVEVTTALEQYEEALEYYSEYVQVAPHDNNRYILKYKIYKGRGSQIEELILILEEYLGQEYTERWAYELAVLYQRSGQMQKCFATCDDLVLWFHSGKYVKKALELKKRYASLTPKQQQIYEECLQEAAEEEYLRETEKDLEPEIAEETILQPTDTDTEEVITESIIAQTEKEIADQVTAHKAEMDKTVAETELPGVQATQVLPTAEAVKEAAQSSETEREEIGTTQVLPTAEAVKAAVLGAVQRAETTEEEVTQKDQPEESTEEKEFKVEEVALEPVAAVQEAEAVEDQAQTEDESESAEALQVELAKSVRKIISGVIKEPEESDADLPASMDPMLQNIQRIQMPQPQEPVANQLSIDDILLSMSDHGRAVADAVIEAEEKEEGQTPDTQTAATAESSVEADAENTVVEETMRTPQTVTQAKAEELTDIQKEALQYTNHPERLLRNTNSLPTYMDGSTEFPFDKEVTYTDDDEPALEKAQIAEIKESEPKEEEKPAEKGLFLEKTRRLPGRFFKSLRKPSVKVTEAQEVPEQAAQEIAEEIAAEPVFDSVSEEIPETVETQAPAVDKNEKIQRKMTAAAAADAEDIPEFLKEESEGPAEFLQEPVKEAEVSEEANVEKVAEAAEPVLEEEIPEETVQEEEVPAAAETVAEEPAETAEENMETADAVLEEEIPEETVAEEPKEETLMIPAHLRGLFRGFTEVEGLEDQIANAIIQAEAKGKDRTSRTGNILIFGGHASGKTTLAMNIAKAIAQDKGSQVLKIAKIYAADLNRKDIAATVAKIAGGTLIIEEAGDLEQGVVEQLTTAMEFRTDGLVVILEDEQQYIHELLMKNPRFTMKFTAQIYIPAYTVDELAGFAQIYANAQDFTIGEEAYPALCQKISDTAAATGTAVSIADVIDIVNKAISRSNKFFRKMSMGKKRYDSNDYVVLYPKDIK